jgi:hypothetical protein
MRYFLLLFYYFANPKLTPYYVCVSKIYFQQNYL